MHEARAGDRGEAARRLRVGRALELDRAKIAPAGAGFEPSLDQPVEPRRIAYDIREQPIDRAERMRLEREGADLAVIEPGQRRDARIERRLVDADDARAGAV